MTTFVPWSEREDDILRRAYMDGYDDEMIKRILASNAINRTLSAIGARRRRLCLTQTWAPHQQGIYRPRVRKKKPEAVTTTLPKDAPPLKILPDRRSKEECVRLLVACMREARAATVGDLRAYVQRFELDIPRGVPRDVPVDGPSRSLVGTHFAHCE